MRTSVVRWTAENLPNDPCKNANRMPILDSHLSLHPTLINGSQYSEMAEAQQRSCGRKEPVAKLKLGVELLQILTQQQKILTRR